MAVRHGFLLPMRVVMAVFRGKLRAAIRQGFAQGSSQLPEGKRRQQVENLLNKLGRAKWNVHIRERYPYGHGVLVYLARYLRGGPIANGGLLSCDGQQVVFRYEERAKGPGGQAQQRTMRLPLEQFIGRWLLHVPPPRAVLVRCWGLYAHTRAQRWRRAGSSSARGRWRRPSLWIGRRCEERGEAHPECCPVCGQRLVCTALIPRAGVPPPAETGGSRWHERANGRGRPEANPPGTGVACSGAQGAFGAPGRSTPAPTPADGGADRPACMRLAPQLSVDTRVDRPSKLHRASSSHPLSVGGQSNQALKRTAAGSGVPRRLVPRPLNAYSLGHVRDIYWGATRAPEAAVLEL